MGKYPLFVLSDPQQEILWRTFTAPDHPCVIAFTDLKFQQHIRGADTCFYLGEVGKFRTFNSPVATDRLMHAFIAPTLNYWNVKTHCHRVQIFQKAVECFLRFDINQLQQLC